MNPFYVFLCYRDARPVLRTTLDIQNLESNAVNQEANEHDEASGPGTYYYIVLI